MAQEQEIHRDTIIHKWIATFKDSDQEKQYQEEIWSTSVRRYFILPITIVVMYLPDLTAGRGKEIIPQFIMMLFIATIPLLLCNKEFFKKRQDYICGGWKKGRSHSLSVLEFVNDDIAISKVETRGIALVAARIVRTTATCRWKRIVVTTTATGVTSTSTSASKAATSTASKAAFLWAI